ncbi:hypothetical protein [Anoxybacterium hadale]|uniref:hypothetical protein n=1 Tax=Anoxybacterium hadale TaxID=3408580 RepID=UPI003B005934
MMNTNKDKLVTMPVGKLLLQFSLPAIGGMIVNSLYNLVDRIFVGRIGGLAMTGIGLSLPFMMLLSAVSSLVGIGAAALSDLISSLIAIFALRSAVGHLNRRENEKQPTLIDLDTPAQEDQPLLSDSN